MSDSRGAHRFGEPVGEAGERLTELEKSSEGVGGSQCAGWGVSGASGNELVSGGSGATDIGVTHCATWGATREPECARCEAAEDGGVACLGVSGRAERVTECTELAVCAEKDGVTCPRLGVPGEADEVNARQALEVSGRADGVNGGPQGSGVLGRADGVNGGDQGSDVLGRADGVNGGDQGSDVLGRADGVNGGDQGSDVLGRADGVNGGDQGSDVLGRADGVNGGDQGSDVLGRADEVNGGDQGSDVLGRADEVNGGDQGLDVSGRADDINGGDQGLDVLGRADGVYGGDQELDVLGTADGVNGGDQGLDVSGRADGVYGGDQGLDVSGRADGVYGGDQGLDVSGRADGVYGGDQGSDVLGTADGVYGGDQGSDVSGSSDGVNRSDQGSDVSGSADEVNGSDQGSYVSGSSDGVNGSDQGSYVSGSSDGVNGSDQGSDVSGSADEVNGSDQGSDVSGSSDGVNESAQGSGISERADRVNRSARVSSVRGRADRVSPVLRISRGARNTTPQKSVQAELRVGSRRRGASAEKREPIRRAQSRDPPGSFQVVTSRRLERKRTTSKVVGAQGMGDQRKRSSLKKTETKVRRRLVTVDSSKAKTSLEALKISIKQLHWKEFPMGRRMPCDVYWHGVSFHESDNVYSGQINKFPGMVEMVRKINLSRAVRTMQELYPEEYDFYPQSWILPEEYAIFTAQVRVAKENDPTWKPTFIVKPDNGCQGEGIYLVKDPSEVRIMSSVQNRPAVVQEYISNPLLMDRLKFDIRLYVLLKSLEPLEIYISRDGLSRFCTEPYHEPNHKNLHRVYMHLTNYSLNVHSGNFIHSDSAHTGSKRTFSSVLYRLSAKGYDVKKVWSDIISLVIKTIIALVPELKVHFQADIPASRPGPTCFQILGFDILLLKNLKPVLLEVNANPSMKIEHEQELLPGIFEHVPSLVDEEIKIAVIRDTLRLMDPRQKKSQSSQSSDGGMLAISELNIESGDLSQEDGAKISLKQIFPKYAKSFNYLRVLERIAALFLRFQGIRGTMKLGPTGFRTFVRTCNLCSGSYPMASGDILYIDVTRRWNSMTTDQKEPGMCLQAFFEAFFFLAQKRFKGLPIHEQVQALADLCHDNVTAADENRILYTRGPLERRNPLSTFRNTNMHLTQYMPLPSKLSNYKLQHS